MKHKIENNLIKIQSDIINAFESLESENGSIISLDEWKREEGGGGKTFVIENGSFFDKCAVNFSSIKGNELPKTALAINLNKEVNYGYKAMGVSVISHPKNPNVPTVHLNVRLFVAFKKDSDPIWWFGGGFDMTPYYGFEEDAIHWHKTAYDLCEPYGNNIYEEYKKNCDDYFFIKHRKESRGIGGIFFDDLNIWDFSKCFNFIKDVGHGFLTAYEPIIRKRFEIPFSEKQKDFQQQKKMFHELFQCHFWVSRVGGGGYFIPRFL